MPYTLQVEGMEEITAMLADVENSAQGIAALALYEGAGIVADAISKGARGLKTAPFKYAAGGVQREASPEEKAILTEHGAAGIAKFDKEGNYVGTAVGYSRTGYGMVDWNHMRSKARTNYKIKDMKATWAYKTHMVRGADGHATYDKTANRGLTNAKAVAVIANAINSGTSFMKKQPFIRKAVNQSKAKASEAIAQKVKELVEAMIKSA